MAIDGIGVAYVGAGFVIAYSGIKNTTIRGTLTAFLKGAQPIASPTGPVSVGVTDNPSGNPSNQTTPGDTAIGAASGGPVTATTVTSIQNYGLARLVAGTYGWAGGNEWASLTEVIDRESGGNPNAVNPSSGAYGIAQAYGHGTSATRGTVTNEYGGYGVPDSTAVGANSGNATDQLIWMMAYIKATYGDPAGAWKSEQERGSY